MRLAFRQAHLYRLVNMEVTPGFEPGNEGFADPCLTTWLCHRIREIRKVLSVWSGRRGSNSLPRPWQGRALPDELRPQTQGGLYRIFCGLSTLHFRFARKNQNQGPKALSTPSISPPRRCFQCWDRSSPSSPSCPVRPAPAPRSAAPAVPGYRWS